MEPKYKRILLKLSGEALSDAPRGILNFEKIEEIGKVIKEVAAIAGGGGGGKPDSAQAGGKDVTKAAEALSCVTKVIEGQL